MHEPFWARNSDVMLKRCDWSSTMDRNRSALRHEGRLQGYGLVEEHQRRACIAFVGALRKVTPPFPPVVAHQVSFHRPTMSLYPGLSYCNHLSSASWCVIRVSNELFFGTQRSPSRTLTNVDDSILPGTDASKHIQPNNRPDRRCGTCLPTSKREDLDLFLGPLVGDLSPRLSFLGALFRVRDTEGRLGASTVGPT
jgi:hypothetical protein